MKRKVKSEKTVLFYVKIGFSGYYLHMIIIVLTISYVANFTDKGQLDAGSKRQTYRKDYPV